MNIMALFKEYLPIWAEQKMQPMPSEEHPDRWALAWKDFQNEYLPKRYEEITEEYKNMQFKTHEMKHREKQQEEKKVIEKPEPIKQPELSEWEKIQKLLDN